MTPFKHRRRQILRGGIALAATGLAAQLLTTRALAAPPSLTVYKDPNCGCCRRWIKHLREHGFDVSAEDRNNMAAIKDRFAVPAAMRSCHTATVADYVIEGHVPAADIQRLLDGKPPAVDQALGPILGLAVPGMPIGSPGMEMGDRRQPFRTWLMMRDGNARVYAEHPA